MYKEWKEPQIRSEIVSSVWNDCRKVRCEGRYRKWCTHVIFTVLLKGFFLLNKVMLGDCSPKSPMNIFASVNSHFKHTVLFTKTRFCQRPEGGERQKKIPRRETLTKRKSYLKSENPGNQPNVSLVMSSAALIFFQGVLGGNCACLSQAEVQSHSLSVLSESRRLHILHSILIMLRFKRQHSGLIAKTHKADTQHRELILEAHCDNLEKIVNGEDGLVLDFIIQNNKQKHMEHFGEKNYIFHSTCRKQMHQC